MIPKKKKESKYEIVRKALIKAKRELKQLQTDLKVTKASTAKDGGRLSIKGIVDSISKKKKEVKRLEDLKDNLNRFL